MNNENSSLNKQKALHYSNQESKRITRESIEMALIDLLSKKDLKKISISEITTRAGVSRSAFYRNYADKEEILTSISNQLLSYENEYFREILTHKHNRSFYQKIFTKVRKENYFFELVIKTGILEKNSINISNFIDEKFSKSSSQTRYLLFGWTGMMLHIIVKWYEEGMMDTDETMGLLCYDLFEDLCKKIQKFDQDFLKHAEN